MYHSCWKLNSQKLDDGQTTSDELRFGNLANTKSSKTYTYQLFVHVCSITWWYSGDGKEQINRPLVCWKTWIGIGAHACQHIMRGRSWLSTSKDTFWILLVQSRGTSWTVHSPGASVLGLRDFTVCRGDSVSKVNQVRPSARRRGGYGLGVCGGTGRISYLSSFIRPIKQEESDSSTATIQYYKIHRPLQISWERWGSCGVKTNNIGTSPDKEESWMVHRGRSDWSFIKVRLLPVW